MRTRFVLSVLLGTTILSPSFAMIEENRDLKRSIVIKSEGESDTENPLTLRQKQLIKLEEEAKNVAEFLESNPNDAETLDRQGCLKATIELLQQDICATQFAKLEMKEAGKRTTNRTLENKSNRLSTSIPLR